LVDQLGFYFEDAKPLAIVLTSLNYDLSHLNVLALAPESVLTVILNNDTSEKQTVTQMETIQTSDSSTTTIAETSETSVSFTAKVNLLVTEASITTGYKEGETYSTGSMHTD